MKKVCSCCHIEKEVTEFGRKVGAKDGLEYDCFLCKNLKSRRARREKKYAMLTQPTSDAMLIMKTAMPELYYELYSNRGRFREHIELHFPKLYIKIYL